MKAGATCSIGFNEANISEDRWSGQVLEPLPPQTLNDIAILVNRPQYRTEDREYEFLSFNPEIRPDDKTTSFNTTIEARRAFKSSSELRRRVTITPRTSDSAMKRQINSLRNIQDMRDIWWTVAGSNQPGLKIRELLLGLRIGTLYPQDMFSRMEPITGTIDDAIEYVANLLSLSEEQRNALRTYRAAKGGFNIITGPAGTGKTLVYQALCYVHYVSRLRDYDNPETPFFKRPRGAIIYHAPINQTVNRFTEKVAQFLEQHTTYKDCKLPPPLVTRFHTYDTDAQLLLLPANVRSKKLSQLDPTQVSNLAGMPAAADIMRAVDRARYRPHSVRDSRVEVLKYSLGLNMARIAGKFDEGGPHDKSKQLAEDPNTKKWFSDFINGWAKYKAEESISPEEKATFTIATSDLARFTLDNSDVICTTTNLTGDAKLRRNVTNPNALISDEMAKAIEPDTWCNFGQWPEYHHVYARDVVQLPPQIISITENGFTPQLRTTFIARALVNGASMTRLTVQHRSSTQVAEAIRVFYPPEAFKIPSPNPKDRLDLHTRIRKFISAEYNVYNRTVITLGVQNSHVSSVPNNPSKYNEVTLAQTVKTLKAAINYGIELEHLGIVTLY